VIFRALLNDASFQQLSPESRLVLITIKLLLPGWGIDVVPAVEAVLVESTGCPLATVQASLEILAVEGWIRREGNVVWLRNGLRFEPTATPNNWKQRQALHHHLAGLPRGALVDDFRAQYAVWQHDTSGARNGAGASNGAMPPPIHASIPAPIQASMLSGVGVGVGVGVGNGGVVVPSVVQTPNEKIVSPRQKTDAALTVKKPSKPQQRVDEAFRAWCIAPGGGFQLRALAATVRATEGATFITPFLLLWNESKRVVPGPRMGYFARIIRDAALGVGYANAVSAFRSWAAVRETPKRFDHWLRDIQEYLPEDGA